MSVADGDDTILVLAGIGIPPFSARGLKQTLDPIPASIHLERAVDGSLLDFSIPELRKYMSEITCSDQENPAFGGIWAGAVVTVDCVKELSFPTASPSMQERTAVDGSVRINGNFTVYRPRLTMKVTGISEQKDEWGAVIAWTLHLEEA